MLVLWEELEELRPSISSSVQPIARSKPLFTALPVTVASSATTTSRVGVASATFAEIPLANGVRLTRAHDQ